MNQKWQNTRESIIDIEHLDIMWMEQEFSNLKWPAEYDIGGYWYVTTDEAESHLRNIVWIWKSKRYNYCDIQADKRGP